MSIKRESILSLVGSGRYHSCIVTAFSFDFYYFEMKVMKWLRSCGIRNVNVFIDGHLYADLMKQSIGDEMSFNPGYALYPIFPKGLFHPKVWLLFGKSEGLLIIGSGNLTSSGLGGNEEIWGAFHFDIKNTNNLQIFSAAWQFISNYTSNASGLIHEKTTKWIYDYSPWLKELQSVEQFSFFQLNETEQIAFLYNTPDLTIWQQLINLVGNETITEITAISPFYDQHGNSVLTLKNTWKNAKLNIVLDDDGAIPFQIPQTDDIKFYDWKTTEVGVSNKNRLHAKLLHLKTTAGTEFCLFGSANITPEGLGLPGIKSSNEEASVLIKSTNGNVLSTLSLDLKSLPIKQLRDFKQNKGTSIYNSIIKDNKHAIRLLFAEKDYESITIYPEKELQDNLVIKIFNTFNQILSEKLIEILKNPHSVKLSANGIHSAQIFDKEGISPVSNKILIHDYFTLSKTHPDPRAEDIETIVNDIQTGELHKVVDLLQYVILDNTEIDSEREIHKINTKSKETAEANEQVIPAIINLSEYKAQDVNQILRHKSVLLSPSLRILDVLKSLNSGIFNKFTETGIREDEQLEDISNSEGNELNEVQIQKERTLNELNAEKRKLISYFNKLAQYFHDLLYHPKSPRDYKVTLTDLTKFVIALELMYEYGGKIERYTENTEQHYIDFLPYSINSNYKNEDIKGCLLNIIGDFQYLALKGFKEYEFDYTKQRLEHLKTEALVLSIFLIANQKWTDSESHYLKLLILNSFHSLNWSSDKNFDLSNNVLINNILERKNNSKHVQNIFNQNFDFVTMNLIKSFKTSMGNKLIKAFEEKIYKGEIILLDIIKKGFCLVQSVSKVQKGYELKLIRPGFNWSEKEEEFVFPDKITINKFNKSII